MHIENSTVGNVSAALRGTHKIFVCPPGRPSDDQEGHGLLAHLEEHLSCKQEARGSSPWWSTQHHGF